jgi:protein-S-isoprenylcysteine O-methyltransferase Ste14
MSAKLISILATILLIADATVLAVRGAILCTGPVSMTLQALGLALAAWARVTFGYRSFHFAANPTEGALVTRGPYRYVRNPIYAGAWLIIWAGVATHLSVSNAALGIIAVVMLLVRMFCEEQLLRERYPEYSEYAARTPRLIPFVI